MVQFFDTRQAPRLGDADFWAPIQECDYPYRWAWHRVKDVSHRLAVEDQEFVLSWCRTLGDKLNALDPFVKHVLTTRDGIKSRIFDALGSVIDRHEIGYRQVTRNPAVWDMTWVVDSSWAMLDLGTKALQEQTGDRVKVVTAWSDRRADLAAVPQNKSWLRLS